MNLKLKVIMFLLMTYALSCNSENNTPAKKKDDKKDSAPGIIEWYDDSSYGIIDSNASIEVIGENFNWSEGPVWIAHKQLLLFSDVPENKIFQWEQGNTTKIYLTPSGYSDTISRIGHDGSNGLALDIDGKLILCQSGNRKIARMNATLDNPAPQYTTLADNYNEKKFNSPNDLVTDSKNNIYFTDPVYGLPGKENDPSRELDFEGIFKINAAGKTILLIDSIPKPNGITLSQDEKILYIASSDEKIPRWYAYYLDEGGKITRGGVLLDALPLREKASVKQSPDGLKIDKYGNIFASGPNGINIISPGGKLMGLIKIYNRPASNCVFNETKDVLYITADDLILKVTLHP